MAVEDFGPYAVGELIGRGGMGEVHRAYDSIHQRTVALKRIRPDVGADDRFRTRFLQECQRTARLTEPHVIPIHHFGEIDGRLFLDMRLVEGRDLREVLATEGPLPPELAVDVVGQVAAALDAAHAAGLVHRDVKPSNVLVSPDPVHPHCFLADFGVSSAVGGSGGAALTATGATVGTIDYLAPERLLGAPADHRVDVYALACLLHEALTGHPPFRADELPAMINAHLNATPPQASALVHGVPAALDAVVARGMAKDPGDRYGSAGQLAAAARAALAEKPAASPVAAPLSAAPLSAAPLSAAPTGAAAPQTVLGALGMPRAAGTRTRRRRRPRMIPRALALLVVALAITGLVEAVNLLTGGPVLTAEAAGEPGEDPFTPPAAAGEAGAEAPPGAGGAVSGDAPGVYGGSGTAACDTDSIATFLEQHPDRGKAWADAQGIQPQDIRPFLSTLTPVTLRTDTAVTNHGYQDGRAVPFQAVLQAGTSVLVDEHGVPRVRCACGNPLQAAEPQPGARLRGATWPGRDAEAITVIEPAPEPVSDFVLMDSATDTAVSRPKGTGGEQDRPADPATTEAARGQWTEPGDRTSSPVSGGESGTGPGDTVHDSRPAAENPPAHAGTATTVPGQTVPTSSGQPAGTAGPSTSTPLGGPSTPAPPQTSGPSSSPPVDRGAGSSPGDPAPVESSTPASVAPPATEPVTAAPPPSAPASVAPPAPQPVPAEPPAPKPAPVEPPPSTAAAPVEPPPSAPPSP